MAPGSPDWTLWLGCHLADCHWVLMSLAMHVWTEIRFRFALLAGMLDTPMMLDHYDEDDGSPCSDHACSSPRARFA
jgi:hypothetical protein